MKTENEQKKEFLKSYGIAKRDVIRLELQLQELQQNQILPRCIIGDGMPHGYKLSDLSGYAAKADEIENEIINARYKRIIVYKSVRESIEKMEDEKEKTLLTYRYINEMKWEEICTLMGHSWQHIHRIHAKAINNFHICDRM